MTNGVVLKPKLIPRITGLAMAKYRRSAERLRSGRPLVGLLVSCSRGGVREACVLALSAEFGYCEACKKKRKEFFFF